MVRGLVMTIAALLGVATLSAQSYDQVVINRDTVTYRYTPIDQTSQAQAGVERFGLRLNDLITYAEDDPRSAKFSVVGGPAYSESTGWRLSAVAMLYYRTPFAPSPHSIRLGASASHKGCYAVALDGVNHFGSGHTLLYGGSFSRDRYYLYGLDYATSLGAQRGLYTMRNYEAYVRYNYHITSNITVGLRADYVNKYLVSADAFVEELVADYAPQFSGLSLGVGVRFSTCRTQDINLTRGVVVAVEYGASPAGLNSTKGVLHTVEALLDYYQPLWRGGLLALDLYGEYHSMNTPWMCRAMLGGDNRMRGYYYGRYNGNSLITAQLELRQRVWEGLVVAGWGGGGMAFSEYDAAALGRVLPTYGAGLRWYFNPSSLVRIDYGFGRGCSALIIGYAEAF